MTPVQWTMFGVGLALWLFLGAILAYTTWAAYTGRRTVSGMLKNAPNWAAALVGLAVGGTVGALFSHWYWPTSGG